MARWVDELQGDHVRYLRRQAELERLALNAARKLGEAGEALAQLFSALDDGLRQVALERDRMCAHTERRATCRVTYEPNYWPAPFQCGTGHYCKPRYRRIVRWRRHDTLAFGFVAALSSVRSQLSRLPKFRMSKVTRFDGSETEKEALLSGGVPIAYPMNTPGELDSRAAFAMLAETSLPYKDMTPKELAMASILSGNWPGQGARTTVSDLIDQEATAIDQAQRRVKKARARRRTAG